MPNTLVEQEVVPSVALLTQVVTPFHFSESIRSANCGVIRAAMMEPPSHGSTLSFFEAL